MQIIYNITNIFNSMITMMVMIPYPVMIPVSVSKCQQILRQNWPLDSFSEQFKCHLRAQKSLDF